MRMIHKKSIAVLVVFLICLTSLYQPKESTYASNANKYLVLVQQKNGSWKEYKNIIETSSEGNLMIKAKLLSKALGFNYQKNSDGTFVIQRSATRYNTYTKANKEYSYTNSSVTSTIMASNEPYTSKTSNYNLCQVSTLNSLVNYKYFNGADTKDYSGYTGIICYSKYKLIPDTAPKAIPEPTKKPTPTPKPEPASISIEGVEFPVRSSFLSVKQALSDWGGTSTLLGQLEREVDGKIIASTNLIVASDTIEFTHLGAGSDGVNLSKASSGYKLSISVKLAGSVIADQNAAIVKALVATISSKPTLVYTAIYESFTSDDTHGIKEGSYIVIGDCKVKVEMIDGKVIYYIKEA